MEKYRCRYCGNIYETKKQVQRHENYERKRAKKTGKLLNDFVIIEKIEEKLFSLSDEKRLEWIKNHPTEVNKLVYYYKGYIRGLHTSVNAYSEFIDKIYSEVEEY